MFLYTLKAGQRAALRPPSAGNSSSAVLFAFTRVPAGRYAGWASLPPPQPAAIRQLVEAVPALAQDPGPANLTHYLAASRALKDLSCTLAAHRRHHDGAAR
jgi:hypothetical protein